MMGVVIPYFTRETFLRLMGMNADKNYLTALELAALADNQLLTPSVDGLRTLLTAYSIFPTEDETPVLERAVEYALMER